MIFGEGKSDPTYFPILQNDEGIRSLSNLKYYLLLSALIDFKDWRQNDFVARFSQLFHQIICQAVSLEVSEAESWWPARAAKTKLTIPQNLVFAEVG